MYQLSVINYKGEALSLSNNPNYVVYKITGLNPPKININQSVNTTQDGSTINSLRMNNRNIVIYLAIDGDIETNRINLYKFFTPKKNVTIHYSNDSRDVYIDGVVEVIECDVFTNKQVAQISVICPKPYFIGVDDMVTNFGDINDLFELPFSISSDGVEISNMSGTDRKSIINTGDTDTGVIIELQAYGEVVNPVIYDALERTKIALNYTMSESDLMIINTNVGEKSVTLERNGSVINAIGYLTPDSTWLQLKSGDNVFTYDADSGKSNLQITIKSKVLYDGV